MAFEDVISAQAAGQTVRFATLVWFDFLSRPLGVWNGVGTLETPGGREWLGLGQLGSVEGLEQPIGTSAPELRFSLSGVDETFATKAKGAADEYYNRAATVFGQFFGEDWQTLDEPFAIGWGLMRKLIARRDASEDGGWTRTVTISAETPFAGKRRPAFSYLTDRDQQQRHPGDRGAERTAGIEAKLIRFPAF